MTDVPRKIWAKTHGASTDIISGQRGLIGGWREHHYDCAHLYHHDDLVRELVESLKKCRDELDAYSRQEYPLDHPVHERYRQRDFAANPARIVLSKIEEGTA